VFRSARGALGALCLLGAGGGIVGCSLGLPCGCGY
jgi:hypothetical protein